jgi:hypothetical protein
MDERDPAADVINTVLLTLIPYFVIMKAPKDKTSRYGG